MSSGTYQIIRAAMVARQQITCTYKGLSREICPHCIGINKYGAEQVLSYQFAGQSSKGLPAGGEWRCMEIGKMLNVQSRAGDWHTGNSHLRPQKCVKVVDLEING